MRFCLRRDSEHEAKLNVVYSVSLIVSLEFIDVDLSRAFDAIRRDTLLKTLCKHFDESELRVIPFLLDAHSSQ